MQKMKQIGVGILGFGTVGAGVADGLLKHRDVMAKRLGVDIVLRKIADLDITTDRGIQVPEGVLTTDAKGVLSDPEIDIVVETIGGTGVAKTFVLEALGNGKCVVTANKKLLAEHGREIFETAAKNDVDIYFGASVGGGIPIIRVLREGLAGNEIESIHGILNGTCNYILTRMENEGLPFESVLKDAQKLGYAEANPSLDIDGFDTAHKACILAALAYGFQPGVDQVQVEGIRNLDGADVKYAADFGYRIKLLAVVAKDGSEVEVGVHPTLIPFSHMLANVNDAFNAAYVKGDMSDYTMYYGRGAGRAPTASTVIGDIGDIARNLAYDETRYARGVPNYAEGKVRLRAAGDIRSKYYLRFMLADRPGAMGVVASALGKHGVSISALSQKESSEGNLPVPVVAMTRVARAADIDAALEEIKAAGVTGEDPVKLRVL
ncbi:MAG: homoserine dehydrogenase [Kiritimatiellae bacterium]|jgi:homoserine dehydrogenase|nr:homoserine dehydrogenase [Kiritimatiellia bacterium]